jgi:hypothetical protein
MKPFHKKFLIIWALAWGTSVLLLVIIHIFMVTPQKDELKILQSELLERKAEYSTSEIADSAGTRTQLSRETEQLSEQLSEYVVERDNLSKVIFSVKKFASEIGLRKYQSSLIAGLFYEPIDNCYRIGNMNVRLSFNSTFNEFAWFVNTIERHKPIIFIESFSVEQPSGSENELQMGMVFSTFVRMPYTEDIEVDPADKEDLDPYKIGLPGR